MYTHAVNLLMLPFLLVAFGGVFLLVRGLWPRRRGATPYCRKCGYNLTGLELYPATHGERPCPECGLDLALVDSAVIGRRVRRPLLAGFGLLLVLVGGWPFGVKGVAAILRANWYSKLPTWWVMMDLRGDDENIADRACREVQARLSAGTLSVGQLSRLTDACLDEQARPKLRPGIGEELINLLGDSTIELAMTANQQRRYASNFARDLSLSIRPRVIADQRFRIRLNRENRIPVNRVASLRLASFTCNGREIEERAWFGASRRSNSMEIAIDLRIAESGRAAFEAVVRIELFANYQQRQNYKPALLASDPIKLTAITEVLPAGSTDDVTLVRSESLDAAIVSSSIFFGSVATSAAKSNEIAVSGHIEFDPPAPCNLAFDVVAEFEGDRRLLGSITVRPSRTNMVYGVSGERMMDASPTKIDIVLRASRDAARDTTDMFEIWGGSLRFKDVPVESPGRSTASRVAAVLDQD